MILETFIVVAIGSAVWMWAKDRLQASQTEFGKKLLTIRIIKILETFGLFGIVAFALLFMTGFGFSTSSIGWMGLLLIGVAGLLIYMHLQTRRFYQTVWAVRLIKIFDSIFILFYGSCVLWSIFSGAVLHLCVSLLLTAFHIWSHHILSKAFALELPVDWREVREDPLFKRLIYYSAVLIVLASLILFQYQRDIESKSQRLFKRYLIDPIPNSVQIHSASYYGWLDTSAKITFIVSSEDLEVITKNYARKESCSGASNDLCWEQMTDKDNRTLRYSPTTRTVHFKYFNQ